MASISETRFVDSSAIAEVTRSNPPLLQVASSRGAKAWHEQHVRQYGEERWEGLHHGLHRDHEHLCVPNIFLPQSQFASMVRDFALRDTGIPLACNFELPVDDMSSALQCRASHGGDEHAIFVEKSVIDGALSDLPPLMFLDGASLIAAHALGVEPEDRVLDACAAPGGKAFVLAELMFGKIVGAGQGGPDPEIQGRLVLNDSSKERSMRMQRTLAEYLPPVLLDAGRTHGPHVVFTSADAGTPSNTMERHGPYDKIFFDAPCVSDRHLVREGAEGKLGSWSPATTKVSSERQLKWLNNALWLLKEGGVLLYCTSALSREECDGVIERLLTKTRGSFELDVLPLAEDICRMVPGHAGEPTDWGTRILPDKTPFGPIYFSRIRLVRRTHESVRHIPC